MWHTPLSMWMYRIIYLGARSSELWLGCLTRRFLFLPLRLVCGFESINDKPSVLNSLTTEAIDHLASLRRDKVIQPYAPLGHWKEKRALQAERNQLTAKPHDDNSPDSWLAFRAVKNKIKAVTNETRGDFLCRAVSPKRPKDVWKVINVCLIEVQDHCKKT